jgi:hypothetical protein
MNISHWGDLFKPNRYFIDEQNALFIDLLSYAILYKWLGC